MSTSPSFIRQHNDFPVSCAEMLPYVTHMSPPRFPFTVSYCLPASIPYFQLLFAASLILKTGG